MFWPAIFAKLSKFFCDAVSATSAFNLKLCLMVYYKRFFVYRFIFKILYSFANKKKKFPTLPHCQGVI